jgi:hypothetical protein
MLSRVQEPRLSGGQEMNFGHSLSRHLQHFGLPLAFTEWAITAQGRAKWHRLATKPPFAIGKPFLRQPRDDTRATPEGQRLAIARRAAETRERWAIFAANANASLDTPTNNPLFDIHRGARAPHTTHSEISGALHTTPCG